MTDATARHIRGSTLLLGGRGVSLVLNLVVQVLVVRYLSQEGYGAFAYALSIVSLVEGISVLGLDRAVGRFVPIYDERGDVGRIIGALAFVVAVVVSIALAAILVVGVVFATSERTAGGVPTDTVLVLLIGLAPIQALDHLAEQTLAIFGSPRSIVIRRHFIGPSLKVLAVLAAVALGQGAEGLAALYLVTGILGLVVYLPLLARVLGRRGILNRAAMREMRVPARELLLFALPLLAVDVGHLVRTVGDAIVLEWFGGTTDVAALRAVQPVARLNLLVFANFALLFMPLASRLFERRDREALDRLYWQTAAWQAIASFPIFAATFSLAGPVTVLLFGERYAASAPIMAVLALGYYINAAFGQNSLTLRVYGHVRFIVVGALGAAAVNLVLLLTLVPPLGALGAALSSTISLIALNVFNQVGLQARTGIRAFDPGYRRVYVSIGVAAAGLAVAQLGGRPPVLLAMALAAAASVAIVWVNRDAVRLAATFPEAARLPIFGRFFR